MITFRVYSRVQQYGLTSNKNILAHKIGYLHVALNLIMKARLCASCFEPAQCESEAMRKAFHVNDNGPFPSLRLAFVMRFIAT